MDTTAIFLHSIELGLASALQPTNLLYCLLGVTIGMVVGVLPGIGALAAISMLFPITYHLEPTTALIMLGGLYYGTAYGGSTTAILLNVPGSTSSAVSCLDGYPMAKQGRGGVALFLTTAASFVAASIGILIMMLFSPPIVEVALRFGTQEYFAVIVLGLVASTTIAQGSPIKGIAMVVLGFALGLVGMDMYTAVPRFTFGALDLEEGFALGIVAIGVFGVTEVIASVKSVKPGEIDTKGISLRSMVPTKTDLKQAWAPTLRGSAIGSFFGALPGGGAVIASFMSYAVEKKIAKDPSRFGKGAVEGICAPEAANNAADQTQFIPTMTLGIPGGAVMALLIGVMLMNGITPGPTLMVQNPDMFWGLVMSFWVGNLMLLVLNIPLIGVWVKLLSIPYQYLYPAILMFVCIGAYSVHNSTFDIWVVAGFGVFGYIMRMLDMPAAPLILGFVLGPMLEEHFRRSLILSDGDFSVFVQRPISATLLGLALLLLLWGLWSSLRNRNKAADA